MEGTLQQQGKEYWWWAGPANDGAKEGYCVHCRSSDFGVTKYIENEPDEHSAKQTAQELIAKVDSLR